MKDLQLPPAPIQTPAGRTLWWTTMGLAAVAMLFCAGWSYIQFTNAIHWRRWHRHEPD